jgi:hypothetical protein
MAKVVIQAVEFANGTPCPVAGKFLERFDFNAAGGLGYGEFTDDPAKAKIFADAGEALKFWRTQSTIKPLRRDGQPNRPLTCTTIKIMTQPHPTSPSS